MEINSISLISNSREINIAGIILPFFIPMIRSYSVNFFLFLGQFFLQDFQYHPNLNNHSLDLDPY
jgi:hypothetical protein